MPIKFNSLLIEAGLDPTKVRLIRHQDNRADKNRTPYRLWRDAPDDFMLYQSRQGLNNAEELILGVVPLQYPYGAMRADMPTLEDRLMIGFLVATVVWGLFGLPFIFLHWDWLMNEAVGFFTFLLVVVAGLQLVLFFWQLSLIHQSLDDTKIAAEAAKTSADAAKKTADATLISLRPWLSCEIIITGPLTYTSGGDAKFTFQFLIKNSGHTPASSVRFHPFLNLMSPKHDPSILLLQRLAQHNRNMAPSVTMISEGKPLGKADLGLVLFPEETHKLNYTIPINRKDVERACEDIRPSMHYMPEVWGIITYTYPLANVRADTGFVCHVENVSPTSETGYAFEWDKPVPSEHIRLTDHSMWGGFAT
jgi:hypothetical protein